MSILQCEFYALYLLLEVHNMAPNQLFPAFLFRFS